MLLGGDALGRFSLGQIAQGSGVVPPAPTPSLDGGNGGGVLRKPKTGLEPLARRPVSPKPQPSKPLLPPFVRPAPIPSVAPSLPFVMPAAVAQFDDVARQIREAESAHAAVLKQSEQDEQDIADVLAALAMRD